jgi:hypothetical protein
MTSVWPRRPAPGARVRSHHPAADQHDAVVDDADRVLVPAFADHVLLEVLRNGVDLSGQPGQDPIGQPAFG